MPFNSINYIVFLAVCALIYYLIPHRAKAYFLLAASYLFYALGGAKYIAVLLLVTLATYFCARAITRIKGKNQRKLILALGAAFCLAALGVFKIFAFSLEDFILPIGISFFTFQALSYLIDVYRGDIEVEKNIFIYALYVSFFPQLTSGPIERASDLIPQLRVSHRFEIGAIGDSVLPLFFGLFKKCVVADALAPFVARVFGGYENYSGLAIAAAACAFAIEIYFDFSGYCDIAKASAGVFGIKLSDNFARPYLSVSIREYWHRWHITLTRFFRDYVYIPLGGSRRGIGRTLLNIMIVFTLSGLWHGFDINCVLWGMLNGVFLCCSLAARTVFSKKPHEKLDRVLSCLPMRIVRWALTFALVTLSLTVFRADTLGDAIGMITKAISHPLCAMSVREIVSSLGFSRAELIMLFASVSAVFLFEIAQEWAAKRREADIPCKALDKAVSSMAFRTAALIILVLAILLFGSYGNGYDASDFFYFRF